MSQIRKYPINRGITQVPLSVNEGLQCPSSVGVENDQIYLYAVFQSGIPTALRNIYAFKTDEEIDLTYHFNLSVEPSYLIDGGNYRFLGSVLCGGESYHIFT